MKSQELENKIEALKEFIDLWIKFHNLYTEAVKNSATNPAAEKEFLDLKSLLARRYQALLDALNIQHTTEDRTFDVITQLLSLRDAVSISELQMQKIENDWHNSFISLNKWLGTLEHRQNTLAKVSATKIFMDKLSHGPLTSLLAIIAAIIIIYIIYVKFFR